MSGTTTRTIASAVAQARTLLQDVTPTVGGLYRYSDQDLLDNFNGAMLETRRARPDLFLAYGLRTPLPLFTTTVMTDGTLFPIDEQYFNAFVYYLVGRAELREDTFSNDSRAVSLLNKFVSQLLEVKA
jgi:hypothetical protein